MRQRPRTLFAAITAATIITAGACASSDQLAVVADDVAPTTAEVTTTETRQAPPDGPSTEWFGAVVDAVDALHEARADAAALYGAVWVAGPGELDANLALFDDDAVSARAAVDALPAVPGIDGLDDTYGDLVVATEALAADAERVAEALRGDEQSIRVALDDPDPTGGGSPAIVAAIGDHADVYERWTRACFALQSAIGDGGDRPLDCIGVERMRELPVEALDVDADSVDVSIECVRGDGLDELGFDVAAYPWLASAAAETAWIRSVVTIENRSDVHVQLAPDFRVHYLDARSELIGERDWPEAFPPAFHAAPGQTVHRTGYVWEGITFSLGLRGEASPLALLGRVFAELESCVIVDEPTLTATATNPHLDPELAELIEVACADFDVDGYFYSDITVSAPDDADVWVEIGVEYVDADGNRQGMGGSREGPARVSAGETLTRVGDSVAYTIFDPAAVTDCVLHSARRCPDDCGPRP